MLERHAIDEAVFVGDQDRPCALPRGAVGEATEVVVELLEPFSPGGGLLTRDMAPIARFVFVVEEEEIPDVIWDAVRRATGVIPVVVFDKRGQGIAAATYPDIF